MQMNLFNLHCRGATGYVAKPNIEEAESFPEALPDMWPQAKYRRSRELPRGATGYVAKPNISKTLISTIKTGFERDSKKFIRILIGF